MQENGQAHICCVFWPAFGGYAHLKAGQYTFFHPFLFISNLFEWFHTWNQQKRSENEQKTCFFIFCLLLKAGRHAKAGWLPEGVHQNHLFWLIFYFFKCFSSVFDWFLSKKLKINKKDPNWCFFIFIFYH